MRNYPADIAFWLAERALRRAERTSSAAWRIRWQRRSWFWSDVECWLAGLGDWRTLRARRRRRIRPLAHTIHEPPGVLPANRGAGEAESAGLQATSTSLLPAALRRMSG